MSLIQDIKQTAKRVCPGFLINPLLRLRSRMRNRTYLGAPTSDVFTDIYQKNSWGAESVSGEGSDLWQTESVRRKLPELLHTYSTKALLDVPCGDFNWMRLVDLGDVRYMGGDIVPQLIEANTAKHGTAERTFLKLDLMRDALPRADILLCRDCLIHLSFNDIQIAIRNILASDITYLLTTTYPRLSVNTDIVTGDFRAINLQLPPFGFPDPVDRIVEDLFPTQSKNPNFIRELGLWRISDLRAQGQQSKRILAQ